MVIKPEGALFMQYFMFSLITLIMFSSHGGNRGFDSSDQLEPFIDSEGMSFSEFRVLAEETSLLEPDEFDDAMSNYQEYVSRRYRHQYSWVRRIFAWEDEIQDIRGFTYMLTRLELSRIQIMYLNELTSYIEYEIEDLRDYHDIGGIRREFFEEFVDDFYMPVSIYFIWEDRGWYESDIHDLIAYAVGEIHDMLTDSQLETAREIVDRMPWSESPGASWPVNYDDLMW
ncbi:MAG: hypothetical protein K8R76_01875 [Candidatus Aegiribacteria sp.]|nr:hypothetical protein [Candidatus Aegiribacteria sp.]